MDAVKFLKEEKRFLDSDTDWEDVKGLERAEHYLEYTPEEQVQIIEKWGKEHPIKTRQTEFLKLFPNARIHNGYIDILPCKINNTLHEYACVGCKYDYYHCEKEYWSEEVK